MKNIITTFVFFGVLISFGQTKKNDVNISNSQNFELSPFSNVVLNHKITKYNFVIEINNIWWSKYHNKRDAEILGVGEYELNTGLVFTKKEDKSKYYYYPIDNNFNDKYFERKIRLKLKKEIKVKIYTTIYKTDSTPVIVIDCIKLVDQ